jgi:hypothetical protein
MNYGQYILLAKLSVFIGFFAFFIFLAIFEYDRRKSSDEANLNESSELNNARTKTKTFNAWWSYCAPGIIKNKYGGCVDVLEIYNFSKFKELRQYIQEFYKTLLFEFDYASFFACVEPTQHGDSLESIHERFTSYFSWRSTEFRKLKIDILGPLPYFPYILYELRVCLSDNKISNHTYQIGRYYKEGISSMRPFMNILSMNNFLILDISGSQPKRSTYAIMIFFEADGDIKVTENSSWGYGSERLIEESGNSLIIIQPESKIVPHHIKPFESMSEAWYCTDIETLKIENGEIYRSKVTSDDYEKLIKINRKNTQAFSEHGLAYYSYDSSNMEELKNLWRRVSPGQD